MRAGTQAKASASTGPVRAAIHMTQDTESHPTVTRTERTLRAHGRSRWSERQSKSDDLARHYGVSASRVRHFSSDDLSGPLTSVLAACEDPAIDGEAILAAVQESVESRYVEAPADTLEQRLAHLTLEAEHVAQARQDRALMQDIEGSDDAIRNHIRILQEILNLRARLGRDA